MVQPRPDADVPRVLADLDQGRPGDREALLPIVYDELRALAGAFFRNQPPDHTLQPTALVHEVYLRLARSEPIAPRSRAHFLALAARVMRQILVDHARARQREKRGGGAERVTLVEGVHGKTLCSADTLALDEAMQRLGQLSERKAQLVELRFFGGLSEDEAADVLGISRTQAAREWRFARAWLLGELQVV